MMNSQFFLPYEGSGSNLYFRSKDNAKLYRAIKTPMSFADEYLFRLEEVNSKNIPGSAIFFQLEASFQVGIVNYVLIYQNEQINTLGPLKSDIDESVSRFKNEYLLDLICEKNLLGTEMLALNLAIIDAFSRALVADKVVQKVKLSDNQIRDDIRNKVVAIHEQSSSYTAAESLEDVQTLEPVSTVSTVQDSLTMEVSYIVRSYSAVVLPAPKVKDYIVQSILQEITYTDFRDKLAIDLYQLIASIVHEKCFVNKRPIRGAQCHGGLKQLMELSNNYWLTAKILLTEVFRVVFETYPYSRSDAIRLIRSFANNMTKYPVAPAHLLRACDHVNINSIRQIVRNDSKSVEGKTSEIYQLLLEQAPVITPPKHFGAVGERALSDDQDKVMSAPVYSCAFAWGRDLWKPESMTLATKPATVVKPSPPSVVGIEDFLEDEKRRAETSSKESPKFVDKSINHQEKQKSGLNIDATVFVPGCWKSSSSANPTLSLGKGNS